jgi:tRNA dimethylallyltransferase
MNKLLIISGPTATGKTALALLLAKKLNGDLISADSRQVYKYMDIVTGKDIPKKFFWKKDHYTNRKINIYGLDLVYPGEQMSAKIYSEYARKVILNIHTKNKLPILVGGTGLYIKSAIDNLDQANIPPNKQLRNNLINKTAPELFNRLMELNPKFANTLSNSDKNNARRLIRKIEIAEFLKNVKITKHKNPNYDILWIGLKADLEFLKAKIKKRIEKRKGKKLEREIEFLIKNNFLDKMPVTIGYKSLSTWEKDEVSYAKRQLTWFKKETRIAWFDVSKNDFAKKVEDMVKKWHNG